MGEKESKKRRESQNERERKINRVAERERERERRTKLASDYAVRPKKKTSEGRELESASG